MVVLLFFSFIAGIFTVLSPCILPILPAILSAGYSKGRLRPIGVVLGVALSFGFFTLFLTYLVSQLGISANLLRNISIIILSIFGLVMLFPRLSDFFARVVSPLSRFGSALQGKNTIKTGFLGGFIIGLALGLVWTPCAGPILASVIALVATQGITILAVIMTIAFSLGAGIPMFLIAYGGHRLATSSQFIKSHSEVIRKVFGLIMILTAVVIYFKWDVTFSQQTLKYVPTVSVENNPYVLEELQEFSYGGENGGALPIFSKAPELEVGGKWFNTKPLDWDVLKGKVVLIDFWTYSCINCLRTLPYLKEWYEKYKDKDFVIIGVHTPEFEFEKDAENVLEAIKSLGVKYPVMQDNEFKTWRNFHNVYWPAHYLIDGDGYIRQVHFGEGGYLETENAIRSLLNEKPLSETRDTELIEKLRPITPETYLGYERAQSYSSQLSLTKDKAVDYETDFNLKSDEVGLKGRWIYGKESITSQGNSILSLNFEAEQVYLVMTGNSQQPVMVYLDGKKLPQEYFTKDMNKNGEIVINQDRKYDIINLHKDYGRHMIEIYIPAGISAYAFTFGDEE